MKQAFVLTAVLLSLAACTNEKSAENGQAANDTTEKAEAAPEVNDKSLYDPAFLAGLADQQVILKDNYILLGPDTVYFSEDLPLNKATVFKATKGNNNFLLTLTRINLTSLNYDFRLTDKSDKAVMTRSGKATLGSQFYLGAETDEDELLGEAYLSTEYWDNSDGCSFSIRVGEKDQNGQLRARLTLDCNDLSKKNFDLYEGPTLRTSEF
jgi:hypothetical protein